MSYLSLPLSMACAFLWAIVVSPLALRLFGLPLRMNFQARRGALRKLGFGHFVFSFGVMTLGIAGLVFSVADAFLEWRFSEAWTLGAVPAPFNSAWRLLLIFATWLIAGIFFGWVSWKEPSNTSVPSR
jgi:hypothetical protein